jgi:hypothetical protein
MSRTRGRITVAENTIYVFGTDGDRNTRAIRSELGTKFRRFVRGDPNGQGTVDLADAVTILMHLFGGGRLDCNDAADVNDDGAVDIADAIWLLDYLFGGRLPLFPPRGVPPDGCGRDPTPDTLGCDGYDPCERA